MTSGLLAFAGELVDTPQTTACIRCGACIDNCPIRLTPIGIQRAYMRRDVDVLDSLMADLCVECGTCSYVCPAKQPLTQFTRLACDATKKRLKAKRKGA